MNAQSIDERFDNIAIAAKTRSIISLGLSVFKLLGVEGEDQVRSWQFKVHTFNITALCSEDYIVEPASLSFLVEHGFDFSKQYADGVPYHRGNDKNKVTQDKAQPGPWQKSNRLRSSNQIQLCFDLSGRLQLYMSFV